MAPKRVPFTPVDESMNDLARDRGDRRSRLRGIVA